MKPGGSFTQQFFAVAAIPQSRVVLAGGLDPINGSRSAFRAAVACYDYAAGRIVWLHEQTKNYPFRALAQADGVCAALLPQNFVRCPKGLFRFDLNSGGPIRPDCEIDGWKIESVDATATTFLFSWVQNETSFLRAVGGRDATFQERSFPYPATSAGKTIARVLAAEEESFVAMFSLVEGHRVIFSVEHWSLHSATPRWEKRTSLGQAVRNDSALLLCDCSGPNLHVETLSLASGELQTSFRLRLADVVAVQPIAANTYAALSLSGVYVIDAAAQTAARVSGWDATDFLDFGALAVDAALGKLIVVTAGKLPASGNAIERG